MTLNGYVLTRTGDDALTAFDDPTVRYAASLDDGSGFLAFEGDTADAWRFADFGRLLTVEPIPEYPDTWPQPRIPKRRVPNGLERFTLVRPLLSANATWLGLAPLAIVQGIAIVWSEDDDPLVLVETDGEWVPGTVDWTARSVEFLDSRLAVSA